MFFKLFKILFISSSKYSNKISKNTINIFDDNGYRLINLNNTIVNNIVVNKKNDTILHNVLYILFKNNDPEYNGNDYRYNFKFNNKKLYILNNNKKNILDTILLGNIICAEKFLNENNTLVNNLYSGNLYKDWNFSI